MDMKKETEHKMTGLAKIKSRIFIQSIIPILFLVLSDVLTVIMIVIKTDTINPGVYYSILGILLLLDMIGIFMIIKYLVVPLSHLNANISALGNKNFTDISESPELLFERLVEVISGETTANMLMIQAEMHALQNQINPHFLYNTLEVIRSHAISHQMDEIAEMTEALATLFRYGIDRPGEMATLAEEIDNVKDYLTIQKYRFGDKIHVAWHIEEDDKNSMECLLPLLTIQPIVENAIHHGLETKVEEGTLSIRTLSTQSKLIVIVTDNGIGIEESTLIKLQNTLRETSKLSSTLKGSDSEKKGSIALINVNQRLKFYFGDEFGLSIESTKGCGTSVEIMVPKA